MSHYLCSSYKLVFKFQFLTAADTQKLYFYMLNIIFVVLNLCISSYLTEFCCNFYLYILDFLCSQSYHMLWQFVYFSFFPNRMMNRSDHKAHLPCSWSQLEIFWSFTIKYKVWFKISNITLRKLPYIPLANSIFINRYSISPCNFSLHTQNYGFFSFNLAMKWTALILLTLPCISRMNPTQYCCISLFVNLVYIFSYIILSYIKVVLFFKWGRNYFFLPFFVRL